MIARTLLLALDSQPENVDALIELTQKLEALEDVSKLVRILGEARQIRMWLRNEDRY